MRLEQEVLDTSELKEKNCEISKRLEEECIEIEKLIKDKSAAFKKQMTYLLLLAKSAKSSPEQECVLNYLTMIKELLKSDSFLDTECEKYFEKVAQLPGADHYEIYKFFSITMFSIGIVLLVPVEIFFLFAAGLILGLPGGAFFIPLASVIDIGLSLTYRPNQTLRVTAHPLINF